MNHVIKVWDLPTRLFHWSLLVAVFYAWLSVQILEDMQQHFYAGYVILTLLLFRLVWGFVGSRYARFGSYTFSPWKIIRYARSMLSTHRPTYLGHNPLGGLSAITILTLLLVQVGLGLFSTDDYFYGPLAGLVSAETRAWLSEQHLTNVNLIYAFLALHVCAIAYHQWVCKEPLTQAMISGNKHSRGHDIEHIRPASNLLALAILLASALIVYWLANAYTHLLPTADYVY